MEQIADSRGPRHLSKKGKTEKKVKQWLRQVSKAETNYFLFLSSKLPRPSNVRYVPAECQAMRTKNGP